MVDLDEVERRRPPLAERIDPAARSSLNVRERGGLEMIEARLPGPFHAAFTTRCGGVSGGVYASLNLDPRSEDDPRSVERNRALVATAVAATATARGSRSATFASPAAPAVPRLISPAQMHGVRVVGAAEYAQALDRDRETGSAPAACDGLILHPLLDKGLAALLLFADCVPIVLVGDVDMAVVHGGWRGILGGIVERAGRAMTGPPGSAVIGPSLGPCCFTVSEDVAEAFARRFGPGVVDEGRVDLWEAASVALRELGVRSAQIVNPRLCTSCNRDLFYSYRAEGPHTGRHGCVAWTEEA